MNPREQKHGGWRDDKTFMGVLKGNSTIKNKGKLENDQVVKGRKNHKVKGVTNKRVLKDERRTIVVDGEVYQDNIRWLSRSIIGERLANL